MSMFKKYAAASTLAVFLNASGVAVADNGPKTDEKDITVTQLETECFQGRAEICFYGHSKAKKQLFRLMKEDVWVSAFKLGEHGADHVENFLKMVKATPDPESCIESAKLDNDIWEKISAEYFYFFSLDEDKIKPDLPVLFDKAATCYEEVSNLLSGFDKALPPIEDGYFPKAQKFAKEFATSFRHLAQKL